MRCDICIYVDRSYIECARCRYATACSESYSNHMSVMHARRSSSVSMATKSVVGMRLRSTLRQDALSCDCGYFSQFGSIIGVCTNHQQQLQQQQSVLYTASYCWSNITLSQLLSASLSPLSSQLPHSGTFSMLLQHQSVVGPSGSHNLCFLRFQHCCPLSMELTPCWHSRLFFITLSIIFLKPTVSTKPSIPPSGSHKCLSFGLWPQLLQQFCPSVRLSVCPSIRWVDQSKTVEVRSVHLCNLHHRVSL